MEVHKQEHIPGKSECAARMTIFRQMNKIITLKALQDQMTYTLVYTQTNTHIHTYTNSFPLTPKYALNIKQMERAQHPHDMPNGNCERMGRGEVVKSNVHALALCVNSC